MSKIILLLLGFCFATSSQAAEWAIGILALRGETATRHHWQPLIDALNRTVPDAHFQLRPLDLNGMRDAVNQGTIQFVLTNQAQFVQLNSHYHLRWLASLRSGKTLSGESSTTGSAILVRSDSHIAVAQDLAGKTLGAIDPQAFGGYLLGYHELRNAGLRVDDETTVRFMGFPADALLYLLREDAIQAAIVPVCLLENMSEEGLIEQRDFRVLLEKPLAFPCATSTALYPDWSFAALPGVGDQTADAVARALLSAPVTGDWRWGAPASTSETETLLRELNRHPEQQRMGQNLRNWFIQHTLIISLFLLIVVLFIANYGWVMILVNRRGKALEHANQQLRLQQNRLEKARQMSILGEMTSGFAHELNQPLSAIRMYAQGGLLRLSSPESHDAVKTALRHIESQADRCGMIIKNLREWASAEPNALNQASSSITINIAETVRHVVALLSLDREAPGLNVHINSPEAVLLALPPILLEQILANVILNAVQAGSTRIWIDIHAADARCAIRIQDNAGGISTEQYAALFQPFNSSKPGGMGLGLVICQRLIRRVNGEISVSNHNAPDGSYGLLATLVFPAGAELTGTQNDSSG